ncbi:MAG: matrixin family metalloprotease [Bacteroidota bacterium]
MNTSSKQPQSQQLIQPESSNKIANTTSEQYRKRTPNSYFGYPKKYSLGLFDSRFGITKSRFLELIQEAKQLWEKPLGIILFEYAQGAPFKLNLIFDERQKKTIESEKLKQTLEVDNQCYDKYIDEYNRESDDISNIETEYEIKSNSFKSRQERHNSKIEYWNANGGAPEDEYSQLRAESSQLKTEGDLLENERQSLNERISNHNSLAQRINDLTAEYNFNIELFNGKFVESGDFEKGSYDPSSNEINIYEFREEADLRIAIAHELGHALGFSHTSDPRSVMYFKLRNQDIRHLHLTTQDLSLLKNTFNNY